MDSARWHLGLFNRWWCSKCFGKGTQVRKDAFGKGSNFEFEDALRCTTQFITPWAFFVFVLFQCPALPGALRQEPGELLCCGRSSWGATELDRPDLGFQQRQLSALCLDGTWLKGNITIQRSVLSWSYHGPIMSYHNSWCHGGSLMFITSFVKLS